MNLKIKEKLSGSKKYAAECIGNCLVLLKKRNIVISLSVLLVSFVVFLLITVFDRNTPYVFSISPEVAMPDEQLVIHGLFFGKEKGTSSVYISDIKVPGSAYEKWSRFEIIVRIPEEVSFGVVRVRNSYGFSNGKLFTGQKAIPQIENGENLLNRIPAVLLLEPKAPVSGETVVLRGTAFGEKGAVERLVFSSESYEKQTVVTSYEAEKWSPEEIRFGMPDGFFEGGTVVVKTRYGESLPFGFGAQSGTVRMIPGEEMKIQADLTVSAVHRGDSSADAVFVLPVPCFSYRQQPVSVKGGEAVTVAGREFRFFETDLKARDEQTRILEMKARLKSVSFEPVADRFYPDCGRPSRPAEVPPLFVPAVKEFTEGRLSLVAFAGKVQTVIDENFRFTAFRQPQEDSKGGAAGEESSDRTDENAVGKPFTETRVGNAFDFAALFADVLEKAGVETRVVCGYYLTDSGEAVPHAWIEYRYPGFGFIPKDPTAKKNGFHDEFTEKAPVCGGISFRYLEFFNRDEKIPAHLYRGYFVKEEEGVFSRQDFYAELSASPEEFTVTAPALVSVKFR